MQRKFLNAFASTILLVGGASVANAAIISSFSGNSRPMGASTGNFVDGTINFAVFERDALPTAGDVFGTGFSGFDTSAFVAGVDGIGMSGPSFDSTAQYMYLYQIVNDGDNVDPIAAIRTLQVNLNGHPSSELTSWGYFSALGLNDADGLVGDAVVGGQNAFGNNGPFDAPPPDSAPADTSGALTSPYVATMTDGEAPTGFGGFVQNAAGSFLINYATTAMIMNTERSVLFVFTSNLGPGWVTAPMQDSGAINANGTVPTLVPAPSSAVMLLSMLPIALCGGFFYRRRMLADVAA